MKTLLLNLLRSKNNRNCKDATEAQKYRRNPMAHPVLQRMNSRELGDIYINPEKTLP